jgi:hypothetical protein
VILAHHQVALVAMAGVVLAPTIVLVGRTYLSSLRVRRRRE